MQDLKCLAMITSQALRDSMYNLVEKHLGSKQARAQMSNRLHLRAELSTVRAPIRLMLYDVRASPRARQVSLSFQPLTNASGLSRED